MPPPVTDPPIRNRLPIRGKARSTAIPPREVVREWKVRGRAISRILSRAVARPEMTIPLEVLLPTPL